MIDRGGHVAGNRTMEVSRQSLIRSYAMGQRVLLTHKLP